LRIARNFSRISPTPFYGYNKPGAKISQGVRDSFWLQGMQVSIVGAYECIKAFSETDFTEDLKKIDVPTLILHGDADQIVPIENSALLSAKLVKNSTLKIYPGAPHGMCTTLADNVNADLLVFLKQADRAAAGLFGDPPFRVCGESWATSINRKASSTAVVANETCAALPPDQDREPTSCSFLQAP
jgi:hypothetical protein